MIREIVQESQMLKKPTVQAGSDERCLIIAKDLADTLRACWSEGRICCSLSANQIGESVRIIALAKHIGGEIFCMFNPKIVLKKEEMDYWEDNACRPKMMYKVDRAYEIAVSYQDANGSQEKVWLSGKLSGLVQQEVDNLNGILPEERATAQVECQLKKKNTFVR